MNASIGPAAGLLMTASAACAVTDALRGTIPDRITYPTFALLLLLGIVHHSLGASIAGAAACGGMLLSLHLATGGRGLGLGDVKLGTCIGAGLGVAMGLLAIGAAFVMGAVAALGLLALRRAALGDALPFGPYLAAGTLIAALGGFAL